MAAKSHTPFEHGALSQQLTSAKTAAIDTNTISAIESSAFVGQALRGTVPTTRLFGGGAVHVTWSASEILPFVVKGKVDHLDSVARLKFHSYIRLGRVDDELEQWPQAIACDLPLLMLVPALLVAEMRELCAKHGIAVARADVKGSIQQKLIGHDCSPNCGEFLSLLIPLEGKTNKTIPSQLAKKITFGEVREWVTDESLKKCRDSMPLVLEGFALPNVASDNSLVGIDLPLTSLLPKLTTFGLQELAKFHGVVIAARRSRAQAMDLFRGHQCSDACIPYLSNFRMQPKVAAKRKPLPADDNEPFVWSEHYDVHGAAYPPKPINEKDVARCVRTYTESMTLQNVAETGCTVCGQLVKVCDSIPFDINKYDIALLENPSVGVQQRKSIREEVRSIQGPVIIEDLSSICPACDTNLLKGRRPGLSLANGLWIGKVPDVLRDLTLGEKALIARVRRNRTLVRVSQGHYKMIANVIAFPNPTIKVYEKLPPHRDDIDDVITILFTGVSPPTDDDLKRTPVLVRRLKVLHALEWLKVNHCDYYDLQIDHEALNSYDEVGVPVGVLHRQMGSGDGNVLSTAKAVFDDGEEQGAEEGPCPFTVHGLTTTKFSTMTSQTRKIAAVQHLNDGGGALAVGHGSNPESIFDNPTLYPRMFPWLFPYGRGGVCNPDLFRKVSETRHRQWLLNYYDKRFQMDSHFLITAFNHQQIKDSSEGSFIMIKRGNFESVARSIREINPGVLANIARRLKDGGRFSPTTDQEKKCFRLMDNIEYVGGHVDGSIARRKYMRNELWSLISFRGAPTWFVTISPSDNRHPLCIFWAGESLIYRPEVPNSSERERIITSNPVACAKFFHFVVELFLTHILGWGQEHRGVFGDPAAYYGTVEQQGRLTLHLHILLWIQGALSPKEIRDKLINGDKEFERKLIVYLESVQVGEFLTGTKDEVRKRIPRDTLPKDKGIHTIMREDEQPMSDRSYEDPTLHFPRAPPQVVCEKEDLCGCENCVEVEKWYSEFKHVVDDIMYRTNVHVCRGKKGVVGASVKPHPTGKGCIGKDGKCAARFPRKIVTESHVDPVDGHISLKKLEATVNCVTPAVTYTSCCNTDTTSLQSGTGIKATVGYVCDYLTKMSLKTHQIFSTMYDAFERHSGPLFSDDTKTVDSARKMILKVVNSLGAKTEIGAPMAALYMLDNPDKYSSHQFINFYWKNYVNYVHREWDKLLDRMECNTEVEEEIENVNTYDDSGREVAEFGFSAEDNERVMLRRSSSYFVSRSSVDDYIYRPRQLEDVCVYEWVQCSVREKSKHARAGLRFFTYLEDHPMATKQKVACDPDRRAYMVPNFIGPPLPRDDDGQDREEYCAAMLALFKPWRTGIDLKTADQTWGEVYDAHSFTTRQRQIMKNFRIRFECYDARDDFHAQRKEQSGSNVLHGEDEDLEAEGSDAGDGDVAVDIVKDDNYWLSKTVKGTWAQGQEKRWKEAEQALSSAGWESGTQRLPCISSHIPSLTIGSTMNASFWTDLVKKEKARLWKERFTRLSGPQEDDGDHPSGSRSVTNDVRVVYGPFYSRKFMPQNPRWSDVMDEIEKTFSLNREQSRSFRIVANHATLIEPEQLLKYLGGMAGTGKTQVLRALIEFFKRRGEPYRIVLLGPTGTSAALIGGTTYHSFLSIVSGKWGSNKSDLQAVEEVRERLTGVSYIFIDEVSMLSCLDVCRISARLCDAKNMHEKPFGGLNVIFAGDFAQLPPTKGHGLYSGDVSLKQTPRQRVEDQEETIGKSIWLQFTCCVILKQNMRQAAATEDDVKFRRALENLRYRACTDEDIAFLRSRIPGTNRNLSVDDPKFRFVSIITSRNVQKDTYNFHNSTRFSAEAGKRLHDFYSIDTLSNSQSNDDFQGSESSSSSIDPRLQVILWDQQPSSSEQVPGRLSLCIGIPVMIRNNDATDLCITRGQEGVVVGWKASAIPGYPGYKSLDTLFVKLTNAPRRVKLPNLPEMVVPLTKLSQPVVARLPNGEAPKISRRQIPVLPNFAMTDYASQGKTRDVNVVDLTMCKSHQAIYTCLSRGKTAADTLIIRDFPSHMLQGGIFGWLRQEFRELNYLDRITELRFEGKLPDKVIKPTRWSTIDAYKKWAKDTDELNWHPVLQPEPRKDEWQRPVKDSKVHFSQKAGRKRKLESGSNDSSKRMRAGSHRGRHGTIPVGPIWDSQNWSCAFDSWIFLLHQLWLCERYRWADELSTMSHSFRLLTAEFTQTTTSNEIDRGLTEIRNRWRELMWENTADPDGYPRGPVGTDICTLSRELWGFPNVSTTRVLCQRCNFRAERRGCHGLTSLMVIHDAGTSVQAEITRRGGYQDPCPRCNGLTAYDQDVGGIWCMQLARLPYVRIEREVTTPSGNRYSLFGVIYFGMSHFVTRIITREDDIFYHDGMVGSNSKWEGRGTDMTEDEWWWTVDGREASMVVYRAADVVQRG